MRRGAASVATVLAVAATGVLVVANRGDGDGGTEMAEVSARSPRGPGEAVAISRAGRTAAEPASYCLVHRDGKGGGCVDTAGVRAGAERLPAAPGETLELRLGARASRVSAWVAELDRDRPRERRVSPRSRATRVGRPTRWSVRLPRRIDATRPVLRFEVRYADYSGDAVEFGVLLVVRR